MQRLTPAPASFVDPGVVSFAGTGQAGTKLIVRGTNAAAAPVVSTMVGTDSAWSGDSNVELRGGMAYRVFAVQTVKGGLAKQAEVTFTVRAQAAQPVTIDAAFDRADEFALATVSGRGEPGATVSVVNTAKNNAVVGTATVGTNGEWSRTVPVSAAQYGNNVFQATMTVGGKTSTAQDTLNYGAEPAAVEITSPGQNDVVSPNGLSFVGNGQAGAKVTVRGTNAAVASAIVGNDNTWTADSTLVLPPMEYKLWAVQATKGGLTKQDEVTFRVQATAITIDAAFDAQDALKPATVSGRGENGAQVVVTNTTTNREVGRATVVNNQWSLTVAAKDATYGVNTFRAVQTINGAATQASDTLNYGAEPVAPTVTSPVPNSDAEGDRVPQGTISFAGTGTPGTQVTVRGTNTAVAPLVTTTVQTNGQWAADSIQPLTTHQKWAFNAIVTTDGGLEKKTPFTFWTQP